MMLRNVLLVCSRLLVLDEWALILELWFSGCGLWCRVMGCVQS
jgi:hypothetical protein